MRVHIEKTHTVKPEQIDKQFRCAHCTCVFKRVSSLNSHVTRVHLNEKFPSNVYGVLKNLLDLEKMTASATDIKSTNENNLDTQVIERDETTEDEAYLSDKDLDKEGFRHAVTLSEVSNDGSLRKYLVKVKKNGDARGYFCNYCYKGFKKPSDLIRHIRIHTKEKPYEASIV